MLGYGSVVSIVVWLLTTILARGYPMSEPSATPDEARREFLRRRAQVSRAGQRRVSVDRDAQVILGRRLRVGVSSYSIVALRMKDIRGKTVVRNALPSARMRA